jgi:hypothetical protein
MRLTDEQIAAIRDGTEGVTPGPWGVWAERINGDRYAAIAELTEQVQLTDPVGEHLYLLNAGGKCPATTGCGPRSEANAAHIARCDPDTIRALASEVLESRAEIAKMRKALSIWDEAFATGRHEPLVAAWEAARAALWRDAT